MSNSVSKECAVDCTQVIGGELMGLNNNNNANSSFEKGLSSLSGKKEA